MTVIPRFHTLIGMVLLLALSSAGVQADEWNSQWKFVLDKAIGELRENNDKARSLAEDARKKGEESRQQYNRSQNPDHHNAHTHYEQAEREFQNASGHYQQALKELEEMLATSQAERPEVERSGIREQLIRAHQMARQTTQTAAQHFNRGVAEFNQGARLYQGAAKGGSEVINEYVRNQAQQHEFQIQRMTGMTKLAMIRVRDQAQHFKQANCQHDLTRQYQQVLELLESARLHYRDAISFPASAEPKINRGKSLVKEAQDISARILDQYDVCLKGS